MATVNGKELAVEIQGSGEAVVMVHGLGGTSNSFGPQAGPLSRFFRVLRFDLPGSGRSPLGGGLSIPGFAEDVVAVMQANGIDRAHLVGHSMGTVICQHVAAGHPDKVASLALLGPAAELPEAGRTVMRDRAAKARAEGMRPVADGLLQVAISAETRAHQPAVVALVRELLMAQDPEGYAQTAEALAVAKAADLAAIACPTLLLTGDEDGVAPPPAVRKLAGAIAGAEFRVYAGCGHWTPLERPREVTEAMLEFYLRRR
jgi:3-oxoadipate enol-lactonase